MSRCSRRGLCFDVAGAVCVITGNGGSCCLTSRTAVVLVCVCASMSELHARDARCRFPGPEFTRARSPVSSQVPCAMSGPEFTRARCQVPSRVPNSHAPGARCHLKSGIQRGRVYVPLPSPEFSKRGPTANSKSGIQRTPKCSSSSSPNPTRRNAARVRIRPGGFGVLVSGGFCCLEMKEFAPALLVLLFVPLLLYSSSVRLRVCTCEIARRVFELLECLWFVWILNSFWVAVAKHRA